LVFENPKINYTGRVVNVCKAVRRDPEFSENELILKVLKILLEGQKQILLMLVFNQ
jgi:hypothetical protein